jgi:hypothetical protein
VLLKDHLKRLIMEAILASSLVGISESEPNPAAALAASDILEDKELLDIVAARMADGEKPVRISLDDL